MESNFFVGNMQAIAIKMPSKMCDNQLKYWTNIHHLRY